MRRRPLKILLFLLTLGGVATLVRQRLSDAREAPAPRASEPFMQPSRPATSAAVRPPDVSSEAADRPTTDDDETPALGTAVAPSDATASADDPAPADDGEPADGGEPTDSSEASDDGAASDGEQTPGHEAETDTAEIPMVSSQAAVSIGGASPSSAAGVDAGTTDGATTGGAPSGDGLALPRPPHGPFTTPPDGPADDLKRISGVGPKLEGLLNAQGITTLAQVAALTEADVDALQARIAQFPGRIRRDRWVDQAKRLTSTS